MKFKHFETNLEKENEYPKLVRDKIPGLIEERTGRKPEMKILEGDEEFRKFLFQKVVEEAYELKNADNKEHVIEEAADIMELIDTILNFYEVDFETLRKVQKEKREARGGFEKRILMLKRVD